MTVSKRLEHALADGIDQIGQIKILQTESGYTLVHVEDLDHLDSGHLELHTDPLAARQIGLYGPDGEYRFTKGQMDLIKGWRLDLSSLDDLRRALDLFYPANLGIWNAQIQGQLRVQNLRDKLSRQTGMYRYAGSISDEGAQTLVKDLCGPGNNCVKKILWKLSDDTPLEDSEASRFNGKFAEKAIPLMCQEACNFFVANCRKVAKKEFDAAAK